MKRLFILPFIFLATSASAQVVQTAEVVTPLYPEPTLGISQEAVVDQMIKVSTTSTTSTSTDILSTTTIEQQNVSVITETIEIIPGSISLKLTAPQPIERSGEVEALTPAVQSTDQPSGLFDLIYTGFEEFVFRVFGI